MKCVGSAVLALLVATVVMGPAEAKKKIVNGNFEAGNAGFQSDFGFRDMLCNDEHGVYTIGTTPSEVNCYGDWGDPGDHTTGAGEMMIIDAKTDPGARFWSETVKVVPNTDYRLTFWGTTLVETDWGNAPAIQAYVNGAAVGMPLQLTDTYDGIWHGAAVDWNSGSKGKAAISFVDLDEAANGNDFAIDDIGWKKKKH